MILCGASVSCLMVSHRHWHRLSQCYHQCHQYYHSATISVINTITALGCAWAWSWVRTRCVRCRRRVRVRVRVRVSMRVVIRAVRGLYGGYMRAIIRDRICVISYRAAHLHRNASYRITSYRIVSYRTVFVSHRAVIIASHDHHIKHTIIISITRPPCTPWDGGWCDWLAAVTRPATHTTTHVVRNRAAYLPSRVENNQSIRTW